MMKKKASRLTAAAVMGMMLLTAAGCGGNSQQAAAPQEDQSKQTDKAMVTVGVVQLAEHDALTNANKGFVDGLAAAGFVEGENITFEQTNAQNDQSNLPNIAQQLISDKVDLICAIATPAAQTLASSTTDIPIVATAVTDYTAAKLVDRDDAPGHNVTGTSDMNPVTEQIDLLLTIAPEAKVIGAIYCSSETNSETQVKIMQDYVVSKGLTVETATVSSINDVQQAAQSLVDKNIDALYVPTDNVVAGAMPTLVGVTDPHNLPVICGEAAQVVNGGLATYGIDYYKLGLQTGAMAARILNGEAEPATMPIENLKDMTYTVNTAVAERLGLKVPQEILDQAELVEE